MTANAPNQPNQSPHDKGYNPITLDDVTKTSQAPWQEYFGELQAPIARCIAAPLLFFIFVYSYREPLLAPLGLLVLLGCLFARMEKHPREIAAVPLTLAAIKLTFQMASFLHSSSSNTFSGRVPSMDPGYIWLPMFFSICLVFIPRRDSVTFKIILAGSCLLLASGLLPGQGFVTIFYFLDISLFLAMVIGIAIDLTSYIPGRLPTSVRPAQ